MDKLNSSAQAKWDAGAIDPGQAPRAVREYLETLDGERMNAIGTRECANAFGAASPAEPKFVPHSGPSSQ